MSLNNFVERLPHGLKIEISLHIFEDRYKKVKYFKGSNPNFISWICPLLKP